MSFVSRLTVLVGMWLLLARDLCEGKEEWASGRRGVIARLFKGAKGQPVRFLVGFVIRSSRSVLLSRWVIVAAAKDSVAESDKGGGRTW